ncbi:MAG: oxidative damage protection protein [Chloroflexi bacterium]|nr:oxidative damage protection protein [Chloroflexota bacterium]
MPRMVKCAKLGRELEGLDRPPVPGELGKKIFENISKEAWEMWKKQSTLLINHYGLALADPQAQKFLRDEMEKFLFEEMVVMPEGWSPEGAGSSDAKGGGGAKGGGSAKK